MAVYRTLMMVMTVTVHVSVATLELHLDVVLPYIDWQYGGLPPNIRIAYLHLDCN